MRPCFNPLRLALRCWRAYHQRINFHNYVIGGRFLVRTTLPAGVFAVNARSALAQIAFAGTYEPKLIRLINRFELKPGVIVNIGANIGLLAVHLARTFPDRRVLAVEPNPEVLPLLYENLQRNNVANRVTVIEACVSDHAGQVELSIIHDRPEYSSIGGIVPRYAQGEQQHAIQVPAMTLAALLGSQVPALVVMDVEGAEAKVLKGGRTVLEQYNPTCVAECSDTLLSKFGDSSGEVIASLRQCGYEVLDAERTHRKPKPPFNGTVFAFARGRCPLREGH
ncbi:MAG: FkbM family methyltransferase [Deltaproteobacteria bacterium]|nr:FkbM family methyltransferase [Deltaproteobacteria bacterium]